MNVIKSIVAASLVAVIAAVSMTGNAHAATAANKCTVADASWYMGKSGKIKVGSDGRASVTFTVHGTGCTVPVTIASWERPTAEGIRDQKLYKSVTLVATPGTHVQKISLPRCMWQVDLLQGTKATAADGTADYQAWDGTKFIDSGLRDWAKGGTGVCAKTPVTPVTPVTPTVPTTPSVPTAVKPASTPVTSVPSTGAGDILMGTTGLSTSVGLGYNLIRRKKLLS